MLLCSPLQTPMMLQLDVPADVAAASSATMMLFTTSSASIVYTSLGFMLWVSACHVCYQAQCALKANGHCDWLCSSQVAAVHMACNQDQLLEHMCAFML